MSRDPRRDMVVAVNSIGRARHGAFISYAREDGEQAARALQARLAAEAPDVPVWLDRLEIEGGIGWWNQIEQELDRVEFFVLVMTPAAMRSDNTRREWRSARQRGVCVYPVKGAADEALDFASLPNWMAKAHFYDPELEWRKLVAHLRRGCQSTRVPFMAPSLPGSFVARPQETAALLALLLTRDRNNPVPTTIALRGAGGFGKTTLAAAICHDDRVIDSFDDGVLWVTLGQTPNLLNELVKLYAALTGERPGFVDVEDAERELTLKLESKNCLIVIDDAWHAAHVAPFLRGGAGCARVITTRSFEVAADVERIDVQKMAPAEALELLLARAAVSPADAEPFQRVVGRLGEWPLALKLAGSAMRQRIVRGESEARALEFVNRALDRHGITAFDADDALRREDAVVRTIGASLDLLTTDERRRCATLSVFPEDAPIPLETAAILWQLDEFDSERLARKLDEFALIDLDLRTATLRIHDVLRAFLAAHVPDARQLHRDLIDRWGDPYALPNAYAWSRYAYHLRLAEREGDLRKLVLDANWLEAKLRATDVHSLIADFDAIPPADRVPAFVRDAIRLAAPVVAADPKQLRAQLAGRLLGRDEPEVVGLREGLRSRAGPGLNLMHPTLDMPGGMLVMTLVGHARGVTALAGEADQYLFSASDDGTVRVWDRQGGQAVSVFGHVPLDITGSLPPEAAAGARAVAVSGDGRRAISGGADGFLYLWDLERRERVREFSVERTSAVRAVALSADGRVAVSATRGKTLKVWNTAACATARDLEGHTEAVNAVALTPDGRRAVSGADDHTVRVWNVESGALERTLYGHTGSVDAVALSPDGRLALSGSRDRTTMLWDLTSGACVRTLTGHAAGVTAVALAHDGSRALSGSSDRTARLWDVRTGEVLATLEGHGDAVTGVTLDATGTHAATGSTDRTIKLWRLDDLRPAVFGRTHAGAVVSLVLSADGELCASGDADGRIMIRDVVSGAVLRTIDGHSAPVRSLAFTEDRSCVLSAGMDDQYWLWIIDDPKGIWIPVRHAAPIDYCSLSAAARYLVTTCADRFVYLWDVPSGTPIEKYGTRRLFSHLIEPSEQRDRTSERFLAAWGEVARQRDLPREIQARELEKYVHELDDTYLPGESVYEVIAVRMSRDGHYALFSAVRRDPGGLRDTPRGPSRPNPASADSACVLVLDISTGEIRSVTAGQAEPIATFATNDDATRLLIARPDHSLELWDLEEERRLATMRGHTDTVNGVAFTAGGRHALSASRDRSARLWDLGTGAELTALTADAALRSLALAPNADTVAVGDVAGRVHFLRLEGEAAPRASTT